MKNSLFYLLLVLLFVSCGDDEVTLSKEEYNKLKGVSSEYPKSFKFNDEGTNFYGWKIVLGGDSHEYLRSNYSSDGLVIIHYPDCKKCLSRDSVNVK